MDRRRHGARAKARLPEKIPTRVLARANGGRVALVVEADAQRRERLCVALEGRGFEVRPASSRTAASDLLDGVPADVLVHEDAIARGAYRVVWLVEEGPADIVIQPTTEGWRRFDEALGA